MNLKNSSLIFFCTFISEDIFNGVSVFVSVYRGDEEGVPLIVFSPFRIVETASKLKIKTNIHVNVCISENVAITVYYPH